MNTLSVYTVTQLTKDIRSILEDTFCEVWVEGEVSNYKTYSSGHSYFSLKDENSLLSCVLFKGSSGKVLFSPGDGLQVLCYGKISVYDKRGQYQLVVTKMEIKGRGAREAAFEKLKEKLYKEGLFAETRKKQLPVLPVRVGIVTSSQGAAIKDILNVGRRRYPNIEFLIRPVKVQGEGAKEEIVAAIKELNEFNRDIIKTGSEEHFVDVIIVGRGGGSLEDLWPFNEEIVARAICDSEIPVVSAVGHEIDYTISDFVADFRAPTPSAAAELVIPQKGRFSEGVKKSCQRLYLAVKKRVEVLKKTVTSLKTSYVLRAPLNVFSQKRQQVDDFLGSVITATRHLAELKERDLDAVFGKLEMLNPLAVLERGYSITFKQGKAVKMAGEVKTGDLLKTRFKDGSVMSRVE